MQNNINCILLIDDDKLVNFVNKLTIDEAGMANFVIKKESALAGINYLNECSSDSPDRNKHCPDVIIVDYDMPEYTGFDFINLYENLKTTLPHKSVIYMLSGFTDEICDVAKTPSLAGFFQKPLTSENLQTILNRHLNSPGNITD